MMGSAGTREALGGRQRQQVHVMHDTTGTVGEHATDCGRHQHLALGFGIGLRQTEAFKSRKEEQLVALDGAADLASELVEDDVVARLAVDVVEVVVGVQVLVPVLLEEAARCQSLEPLRVTILTW